MNRPRVLFVEDDRLVHQSLRRFILASGSPVGLSLAASAAEAERALEKQPCEVVVTDAKLPDATGPDFLGRVRERWPNTLRILMIEQGEEAMIASLLVSAHQILCRPVAPVEFLQAVQSASRLAFLLMDERLREAVLRLEHLPVVPAVYHELTRELRRENCSNQALASIMSRDMGLTTAVLKMVNTPCFGLSRRMDDLLQALNFLGANLIRGLILSEGVFRPQDPDMYPGFNTERLWSHCLDMAKCCRAVAKGDGAGVREAEDAFLGGLLHDMGKIVLAEGCPEDYVRCILESQARNIPLVDVERSLFGITHAQVGAYLLGLWGFSEPVAVAIAQHHGSSGPHYSRLAAIIHAVDVTLHDRYVLSSGYCPHRLEEGLLASAGGVEVLEKWSAEALGELDRAG